MGVVFRGVNLSMDKAVAIKMMRKETFDTPDAVERFKREARVWSQLNHPAITQVFDFGIQDGMLFLVMELVDGLDLSDVLKQEGALKPLRAITLMRQLAAALEEAHRLGVVHRDIKPQNMKLLRYQPGGRIVLKVLDFGMAKQFGSKAQSLTAPGILVGTPKYVAPEQVTENPKIDGRTDLYAAGVLFYELLTGAAPFLGTPHEVLMAHISSEPKQLPESIAPCVQEVVMRLLRKRPEDRYENAAALDRALEECEEQLRAGGMMSGVGFAPVGSTVSGGQAMSAVSGGMVPMRPEISGGLRMPAPSGTSLPRTDGSGQSLGAPPPRSKFLLGVLLFTALITGGALVVLRQSLPLQRSLAKIVPIYKVTQDEEAARTLAMLQRAVQEKNWAMLLLGAEQLSQSYGNTLLPEQQAELQLLRHKALLEQPMQSVFERLVLAAQKQEHEDVVRLFGQLSPESVYRSLAQPFQDRSAEAYVTARVSQLEQLREQHKCTEFASEAQKLVATLPGHPQAQTEQRKPCTEPPVAPTLPVVLDAAQLATSPPQLQAAHQQYLQGQFHAAIVAVQPLLQDRSPQVASWARQLAAVAACHGDESQLLPLLTKKLTPVEQSRVATLCPTPAAPVPAQPPKNEP